MARGSGGPPDGAGDENAELRQVRARAEEALARGARQQAVVAELGRLALAGADLQRLFDQAVVWVAETFGVEYCSVLKMLPDGSALKLVAGVGWKEGLVGQAVVGGVRDSPAGFTLLSRDPVIVEDLRTETRFSSPPLLRDHGVVSGLIVIIGEVENPFGVIGAHTTRRRAFMPDDVNFFQSVANVLAEVIQRKRAEETLCESEERFNTLISSVSEGVWSASADGRHCLYVNPAFERLYGRPFAEFRENPDLWMETVHPDDRALAAASARDLLARGSVELEYRIVRPDGEVRWVFDRKTRVRDRLGKLIGMGGIISDITERKRAQQAAIEQSKLAETFFNNSMICLVVLDKYFNFIRVNEAYARACRRDISEFTGRNHFDMYPSDAKVIFEEVVRTKHPFTTFTTAFLFPDQAERGMTYWDWALVPILDQQGEVEYLVFSLNEVTERRRAEESLRASEERFRDLFENASDLIQSVRPDGTILYVNRAWRETLGYSEAEIPGLSLMRDIVHPSSVPHCLDMFQRILAGDSLDRVEAVFQAKDGRAIVLEGNCSCHFLNGQPDYTRQIFRDVTRRKQVEERMRMFSQEIIAAREQERKQVSSALHHDVGSLAVGVAAHLDAIEADLRSGRPGEALEWTKRVRKLFDESVKRLRGLAVQLRPPELDILGLRAALRQYFSQVTKHGGTRIHFRETLRGRRVSGDTATTLFRIAQEAVTNAIKHGDAKRVDVGLTASKNEVRLTVRDNGKGFDPCEHGSRATSQMGLRVMREMAASAGGAFTVDSGQGKGTTVCARLPLETAALGPGHVTVREGTAARGKTTRSAGRGSRPQKGSGA